MSARDRGRANPAGETGHGDPPFACSRTGSRRPGGALGPGSFPVVGMPPAAAKGFRLHLPRARVTGDGLPGAPSIGTASKRLEAPALPRRTKLLLRVALKDGRSGAASWTSPMTCRPQPRTCSWRVSFPQPPGAGLSHPAHRPQRRSPRSFRRCMALRVLRRKCRRPPFECLRRHGGVMKTRNPRRRSSCRPRPTRHDRPS